jgi:CHAT domain-containing protein/tetratricopeptide (TPR) repeat protein
MFKQKRIRQSSHFGIILSITLFALIVSGQSQSAIQKLTFDQPVERQIKGGETHSFEFHVKAGHYARAEVEQKNIDVVVSLFAPDGKLVVEMDGKDGRLWRKALSCIAETDGMYRLAIKAHGFVEKLGSYAIHLAEKRQYKPEDNKRLEAERRLIAGRKFFLEGTAKLSDAITEYQSAIKLWQEIGDAQWEAITLINLGEAYNASFDETALKIYAKALEVFQKTKDRLGEVKAMNGLGISSYYNYDYDTARKHFESALSLGREIKNRRSESASLIGLANVYLLLSPPQYEKSANYFEQALAISREIKDKILECRTLNGLGMLYLNKPQYEKAKNYYISALSICREVRKRDLELVILLGLGSIYSNLAQYENAKNHYEQALAISQQDQDKSGEAMSVIGLGESYYKLSQYEKAREYYKQSLLFCRGTNDLQGEASTLLNLGNIYSIQKQYENARNHYEMSLAISRRIKNTSLEAIALERLGSLNSRLNQYDKASQFYNQALYISREENNSKIEAWVTEGLGLIHYNLNQFEKALENYHQSLNIYQNLKHLDSEGETYGHLMFLWEKRQNPKLAVIYGKQAVNTYQQIRENIKGLDKESRQSFLDDKARIYRKLVELLIDQGRIAEAEQVLAMLKEEEVFTYLRRNDAVAKELLQTASLTPDEQEAIKRYEQYADNITEIGKKYADLFSQFNNHEGPDPFPRQAELDELKKQLNDARIVFQKFVEQLKLKTPSGQNDKRIAQVETLLRDKLSSMKMKKTAIVSIIIGKDRLNLIVTTANTQKARTVPVTESEINRLVVEFRQALMNPKIDPRPVGQELYDILVKPIEPELNGIRADTIVWSLDGTLRYIPTAALWSKNLLGTKGGYVAQKYANVVLTLASVDKITRSVSDDQFWQALGVGVSKPTDGFTALPAVADELDCIITDEQAKPATPNSGCAKGIFKGKKLLDDKFTMTSFESSLGKYPLIHIASHFKMVPGNERDSFLLLGGGEQRRFTVEDLRSLNLNGIEMIVLSACNTATPGGENANGLEIEAFGSVAQERGVKTVMATLWSVADTPTKDFMVGFYRKRAESQETVTKAQAMRLVQKDMIEGVIKPGANNSGCRSEVVNLDGANQTPFKCDANAPQSHPFFWAPFILIGNWK